nr:response regulator [uncultured Flavobacterium sp.]
MSKILIIDDEIKLRETIAELFSLINYQVFEAQDGSEGLEKVQEHKPDLIICDVMMPKLDGYGFLEEHQKSNHSNIPVLLLSAKIEEIDEKTGFSLGAKGYLRKPFVFKELKEIVDFHLRQKNLI